MDGIPDKYIPLQSENRVSPLRTHTRLGCIRKHPQVSDRTIPVSTCVSFWRVPFWIQKEIEKTPPNWGFPYFERDPENFSGVENIYFNNYAFAARKGDGSVVTWGDSDYGGDSSSVSAQSPGKIAASRGWAGLGNLYYGCVVL